MQRKDIVTRKLADGTEMSIPVFYFKGSDAKAPKAYIQSSVHSSEIQGYFVSLNLIDYFIKNPPIGDVTIVPMANPYGLNNKSGEYTLGRFDPVTGDNWNRHYVDLSYLAEEIIDENKEASFDDLKKALRTKMKDEIEKKLENGNSYAKKLAMQLQLLALEADIVLDLHCDTISVPHVYCASYAMTSIVDLGIEFAIEIPHIFAGALDEATFCPWVKFIERYNLKFGTNINSSVEALTIELGNQENIDEEKSIIQANNILHYLSTKNILGNFDYKPDKKKLYSCKLVDFKTIYAPCGGIVLKYASLGVILDNNSQLYKLNKVDELRHPKVDKQNFLANLSFYQYAKEKCIIITHSPSSVVHEGIALMKVMTNFKLEAFREPGKL